MDAYELRQRAKELLNESTPEANESAKSFASQALNLNPGFVEALNDLAYAHIRDYQYGWSDNPQASLEQALALAEQALSIDQNNYVAHWAVATVALYNNDFERSLTEWGRAVELNPQDTDVLASMVDILTAVGRNEEALEKIEEARQLNPEGPAWYAWNLGYVYYMLGRYDDAITTLEGIGEPEPIFLVELAASYAKRGGPGDDAKAVNAMRRVKAGLPDYDLEDAARQPYQSPDLKEHWLSGVRRAFELLNAQQP